MCSNLERCKSRRAPKYHYELFYMCSNLEGCKKYGRIYGHVELFHECSNVESCESEPHVHALVDGFSDSFKYLEILRTDGRNNHYFIGRIEND